MSSGEKNNFDVDNNDEPEGNNNNTVEEAQQNKHSWDAADLEKVRGAGNCRAPGIGKDNIGKISLK